MSIIKHFWKTLLGALVIGLCSQHVNAQLLTKFGPVNGVLVGIAGNPQTSAAVSSNIYSLFGCSGGTQFLNGAGGCTTPAGTGVTSVGASFAGSWYTVTGSPVTSTGTLAFGLTTGLTANSFLATPNGSTGTLGLRTIVGADVPPINLASTANGGVLSTSILAGTNGGTSNGFMSFTGPTTSLKTFTLPNASATILTSNALVTYAQGGTGVGTFTPHSLVVSGTSAFTGVAVMALDTLLQGQGASSDPAAVAINNCGSSSTALSYSTSTHTFGCQTISVGGSGTVTNVASGTGLSGGPITTTGTLSVDQSFSPTWTGIHTWSTAPVFNVGFTGGTAINGSVTGNLTNGSTGGSAAALFTLTNNLGTDFAISLNGGSSSFAACGNCLNSGDTVTIRAGGSSGAISLATVNSERIRIGNTGAITVNAPTSGVTLTLTSNTSSQPLSIQANTTAGSSQGPNIKAGTNSSDRSFDIANASNTLDYFAIRGDGEVQMPQLAQTSAAQTGTVCWGSARGQLTVDTTVACLASTRRIKENIIPLNIGLAEVMKLHPVSYDLRPEFNPAHLGPQVGLVAEEVQRVDPRLIALDDEGLPRGVRYMQLTSVLTKAIQEQQLEIVELRKALKHKRH